MIEEWGYGKINLALEITGRRDDGYHTIDTVFQSVSLRDRIQLERSDQFRLTCSNPQLSCDESNLAYRAFAALKSYYSGPHGVSIHIDKQIPLAAGLAGGSTDCAAVLRGLNRLWNLGLSTKALCRIGASLGADVPFCICGGTMRGRGIGDVLQPLPALTDWEVLILHPHVPVYTGRAYALFDEHPSQLRPVAVDAAVTAAEKRDWTALIRSMGNTFEELVIPGVPQIDICRQLLRQQGLRPLMAGSGPTVFAVVPPQRDGTMLYRQICQEAAQQAIGIDVYQCTLVRGDNNSYDENG
ncbi:4-(cytidine 5'-diphospho)-2-C-methyl-D-erythritol kinase [uncultured Megasphaera sp.]|uniref:4-(cytidine 5'-diphospho)-2-C-methyl-D-erythritol kinase n=1 Tax=uncultured Megasphaera sp. TaxID=165188 RepID=UPI00265ABD1C|nr:4-(cytidine 5'-diphospho)-2-C-methyl-D-erythritol kinase [uncultured Megasphaera sp.]